LEQFLLRNGYDVTVAHNVKTGKASLLTKKFDLALLDYRLPDGLGMDLLTILHSNYKHTAPIIMTSFHDVRIAVKTIRSGAYDYITKPVNHDELLLIIQEALSKKDALTAPVVKAPKFIEGTSVVSQQLQEYIRLVAPTDFSVIIQGDSGTGKELAARSIHNLSKRSSKAFVALDCGALSADLAGSELFGHVKGAFTGALQQKVGQFEAADGGTIFLDEVGNLSYEIQVKLLRAIQERVIQPVGSNKQINVDVRIIAATNENLLNAVKNGKFREDLYHRLNEFKIQVPSLHDRREDIMLFVDYFIKQTNAELGKKIKGISKDVELLFMKYDWPGNLRELRNIVKRAVLLTANDEISVAALPNEMLLSVQREAEQLASLQSTNSERDLIINALEETQYNKSKAAKLLNIDRTTLYYKMSKYNIG
jgi:two-component system response regulator HydG